MSWGCRKGYCYRRTVVTDHAVCRRRILCSYVRWRAACGQQPGAVGDSYSETVGRRKVSSLQIADVEKDLKEYPMQDLSYASMFRDWVHLGVSKCQLGAWATFDNCGASPADTLMYYAEAQGLTGFHHP